jgi:hypothetical protein
VTEGQRSFVKWRKKRLILRTKVKVEDKVKRRYLNFNGTFKFKSLIKRAAGKNSL